jgi:hypothetical protein
VAVELPIRDAETYLGDGVYASFDGFHVKLRAPRDDGNHWIAMEPDVFQALRLWLDSYPRLKQHMEGE